MKSSHQVLEILRDTTRGTAWENRLWLVGGYVRDKLLGDPVSDDIDLVLESDALEIARFLHQRRVTDSAPVEYGQFGTTSVSIGKVKVEMVRARAETYRQGSRKPIVRPGTLQTDAERRDFTTNALLENLHTGEILDPTGKGRADLAAKILRTPLDPTITFAEDPLRMLRACRFVAKLGFGIVPEALIAISQNAGRCHPDNGVSYERIRDELSKTLLARNARHGLEKMQQTGLLAVFAPEIARLFGVTQNQFHRYDVGTHTLVALENLPPNASLTVRLATLLHDVGKPQTRTMDDRGDVHFYEHEEAGAQIARELLTRLRYPNDEIAAVTTLVSLHMRYGSYDAETWTDAAVRRLIRAVGEHRHDLFTLARADIAACNTDDFPTADLSGLAARMEKIENEAHVTTAVSPLDGKELIRLLGIAPGPILGQIKDSLTDAVVAGELAPDDKEGAATRARALLLTLQIPPNST